MKITDKYQRVYTVTDLGRIESVIDSVICIPCPNCGQDIRVPEAVISSRSEIELDRMIGRLNDYIDSVRLAAIEYFGEDVALRFMIEKLEVMSKEFTSPKLKLVEKEGGR